VEDPFIFETRSNTKTQASQQMEIVVFDHITGLPRQDKIEKLMFDYEKILYSNYTTTWRVPEFI